MKHYTETYFSFIRKFIDLKNKWKKLTKKEIFMTSNIMFSKKIMGHMHINVVSVSGTKINLNCRS